MREAEKISLLTILLNPSPPEFDEQIKGVKTHILINDPPKRITPICLPPAPVSKPKAKAKAKKKQSSRGRKPVAQKRVLDHLKIKKSGEATVKDLIESGRDICQKDCYGLLRRMEKNGLIEIATDRRPLVIRITELGRTALL